MYRTRGLVGLFLEVAMDTTSTDSHTTVTTKMLQSGVSGVGSLQYLNPDYIPPSVSVTLE